MSVTERTLKSVTRHVRITHVPTNTVLAKGPLGWGITPFEGNFYIRKKHLVTDSFKLNFIPGLCIYKFFYIWLDFALSPSQRFSSLGWMYVLPNPLFPFIWFRVALSGTHRDLHVEYSDAVASTESNARAPIASMDGWPPIDNRVGLGTFDSCSPGRLLLMNTQGRV